jgi:hypothetical protein
MTRESEFNLRGKAHTRGGWLAANRAVVAILGTALAARIVTLWSFVANHPRTWLFSHPFEMGLVANSLTHGLGYSAPFGGSTGPSAIIAPGYPTLIAGIFLVFGNFTFASAIVIMGLQILVSVLTIWLMMYVARELFGTQTANLAGAFWAVSLPLLWIPAIFWETSISACSLVGIVALTLRCLRAPTKTAWVILGACCALAALINPALLPSVVAMMAWVAWETRRFSRAAPAMGMLALLLVYSVWPIRNALRFDTFIPLRSTIGMEMYMGNHPGATGRLDDSLSPIVNQAELANYLAQGEVAYTNGKSAQAWAYVRVKPGVFLKLSLRRIYRFWTGTGNADGPALYEIHALLTTILGGIGLALLSRRQRTVAVLVGLPLLLFPLPYYVTHAEFRYRLDLDPLLTILAAYAVTHFVVAWSAQRSAIDSAKPFQSGLPAI